MATQVYTPQRADAANSGAAIPLAETFSPPHPLALPRHYESRTPVSAPADVLFAYIDDHSNLSSHMSQSSWMMGGGRMRTVLDAGRGQQLGSQIRLSGRALGVELSVVEMVTERDPPRRKVWQTTEPPRLLVIGHYRMGFEITPHESGSLLCIFIDYALPDAGPTRWLARLFGDFYARWCTRQMIGSAVRHFAKREARP
jgi:hypothetical protein